MYNSHCFPRELSMCTGRATVHSVFTSTVAKALFEVAEAIGASVTIEKVKRCSDRGSYTADMISKVRRVYLLILIIILIFLG